MQSDNFLNLSIEYHANWWQSKLFEIIFIKTLYVYRQHDLYYDDIYINKYMVLNSYIF